MSTLAPESLDALVMPTALATRWSVTEGHLRNLRSQRRGVPYIKIGGRVAYRAEDIVAFENARLVSTSDSVSFTDPRSPDTNQP